MTFVKKLLFIASILFLVTSCSQEKTDTAQVLDECVSWALGDLTQTVEDAEKLNYQPLTLEYENLSDKVGLEATYVWVKINFKLNDELKDKDLGIVIPYLHFSEKTWFNGAFVGQSGEFEPNQYSMLYQSHFYNIPKNLINRDGENSLYIKVFSFGTGTVSDNITIDEYSKSYSKAATYSFICSTMYMIFSGILFCAFLLFIILYFARKDKNILNFAMICLTTFVFLSYYDTTELPYYGKFSWDVTFMYTKVIQCCFFYFVMYAIVTFILTFVGVDQSKGFVIFKRTVVAITVVITLVMPDYVSLSRICIPMIITYLLHFLLGISHVIKSLFDSEKRKRAGIAARGFSPMIIALFVDLIIRQGFKNVTMPYFVLIGLVVTIVYFIVYFSIDYGLVYKRNQTLTDDLRREVELQTVDLTFAKERLEQEFDRSKRDLEMAGIVQEKFMPAPYHDFKYWELAVTYEPLSKVSGDLYDYYSFDDMLDGISVFDASGHGISASLVTMLSKNIIFKAFKRSFDDGTEVSDALLEIHEKFLKIKGSIENYLTGIMIRIKNYDNKSKIDLASAGHPYPVWYSTASGEIEELLPDINKVQYGAIGIQGIEVSFPDIDFEMQSGDVLVIFTDGVTEGVDENHNQFGRERLENIVLENHDLSAEEIRLKIINEYNGFLGETFRDDDVTFMVLKRK